MNTVINQDLFDRGRAAQKKTIEGIFEFALCVKELKNISEKVVGKGTTFTKDCEREWGLDHNMASKWLKIALNVESLKTVEPKLLPVSFSTLTELSTLSPEQLKALQVTPSTTRSEVLEYKSSLLTPPVIKILESTPVTELNDKIAEAVTAREFELKKKHATAISGINASYAESLKKAAESTKPTDVAKYEAEIASLQKLVQEDMAHFAKSGTEILAQDAKLKGQQIILTRLSNELEVAKRSANSAANVALARDEILKAIKFHKDSVIALEKLLK